MFCLRSRREFLAASARSFAAALPRTQARAVGLPLISGDDQLLEDLSRRCFCYFWEQSDPHTGIVRDRARADGSLHPSEGRYIGSTGATGFALSALCIGAERGWISRPAARRRAQAALHSYATGRVANVHGWFYHFLDIRSGTRYRNTEVSTSDSTWLVAGALTARQYFQKSSQSPGSPPPSMSE